jgi:trimeric autotransporter adhesin
MSAILRPKLSQMNTAVVAFKDPITVIHAGSTAANVDVGFLMNRANGLLSNVALYWNESGNTFVTAFTSNSGATDSNIVVASYAALTTGNITATGDMNITGNLTVTGTTTFVNSETVGGVEVVAGNLVANSGTASTSTTTGALVVKGGAGIGGDMYIAGNIIPAVTNTYFLGDSTHRFANLWLGPGTIYLTDTADPTRTTTLTATNGILQIDGAAGLQANLISGNTSVTLLPNNSITLTSRSVNTAVISSTGITVTGNISATGNISGQYILGDATYMTGIAPTVQQYLFANVASDISPYYQLKSADDFTPGTTTTVSRSVSTSPTLLAEFLTEVAHPNTTTIPYGVAYFNYETQKGSGNKEYITYVELWKRTTGGTETKIGTSDLTSATAVNTNVQQTVGLLISSRVTLNSTDRLAVKVYAYMTSSSSASIGVNFDDNTVSGFSLPLLPASSTNFVPYVNATSDLDLGTHTLTVGNILPASNVTYDLGSSTNWFRDLWLSSGTIHIGGAKIKQDPDTGAVAIIPRATAANPNPVATVFSPTGAVTAANTSGGTISAANIAAATASNDFNVVGNLTAKTATITNDVIIGGNLTIAGNIAVNNAMVDRGVAGTNWDTITQMGTYVVNRVSWSGTTGTPLDSLIYTGLLEVTNSANTAITQNYRPYDSGSVASVFWTRSKFNTTWSAWREIVNNSSQMDGGSY